MGPREAAPQAGAPRRPWGPSGLQTRGWVELSPQSCLQRRSVSLSLLNANLSARESVCRVLFLLQFPREIIQIPRGENVFGNKLLPASVPLVGGGGSSVTLRGSRLPGVSLLTPALHITASADGLLLKGPGCPLSPRSIFDPEFGPLLAASLPRGWGTAAEGAGKGQRGGLPQPACRARGRGAAKAGPNMGAEFGPPPP